MLKRCQNKEANQQNLAPAQAKKPHRKSGKIDRQSDWKNLKFTRESKDKSNVKSSQIYHKIYSHGWLILIYKSSHAQHLSPLWFTPILPKIRLKTLWKSRKFSRKSLKILFKSLKSCFKIWNSSNFSRIFLNFIEFFLNFLEFFRFFLDFYKKSHFSAF